MKWINPKWMFWDAVVWQFPYLKRKIKEPKKYIK